MTAMHPQYHLESEVEAPFTLENYSNHPVCRTCVLEALNTKPWHPVHYFQWGDVVHNIVDRPWYTAKCDCCNQRRISYNGVEVDPKISLSFAINNEWSGHYICRECIIENLTKGQVRTCLWGLYKNKPRPSNEYGLYIDDKGNII